MTTLDHLAKLEAAATPGPWEVDYVEPARVILPPDAGVARAIIAADAALVVAARNALPALIEVARAAEGVYQAREDHDCDGPGWCQDGCAEADARLASALAELARVTL